MKKLLLLPLLLLTLSLAGCPGQLTVHPSSQENPSVVGVSVATQNLIDELNAAIAAAAKSTKANVVSGAFAKTEGATYLKSLQDAAKYVDVAQSMVVSDPAGANAQLNLAQGLLAVVQAQLIKVKNNGK